ncbi:MAG: hypothetical protein CMH63_02750 [Nanoarchaeota archaeon]|jgi:LmbE family N-acetylglucosaminyl deacetylase|nr:hypothetical protein [Nanoarchaeota archaeon]|tara:strand:+ start:1617 stop:2255 length:639 start_codon:yes stop_codon:yes gene_type:complete
MTRNILIFTSHPDDDLLGMGGTILKYSSEDKNIVEVIFSKGEKSHPHLKEEVIVDIRKKEMEKVSKLIGLKKVIHFGLKDLKVKEEIKKHGIKKKVKDLIEKYKPEKIFTLASTETHPDHRAVNTTILSVVDSLKTKYPVYTFNVWTTPKLENRPIMYIDISKYFWRKINILKEHKSQWFSVYLQILPVIFRARYYGYKHNCKYAEKFEKVR